MRAKTKGPKSNIKIKVCKRRSVPYVVKHFFRKHVSWLLHDRQSKGSCSIDWSKMSLETFVHFFPDQAQHATGLGAFGIHTAGSLSSVMQQPPLWTFGVLCLLGRIIKRKQQHILEKKRNHETLMGLIQDHVQKYKFPPSPAWLCKHFLAEKVQASAREQNTMSSTGLGGAGSTMPAGGASSTMPASTAHLSKTLTTQWFQMRVDWHYE